MVVHAHSITVIVKGCFLVLEQDPKMPTTSRRRTSSLTSRQIRFTVAQQLERASPGLCSLVGLISREADFEALAKCGPFSVLETSETPLSAEWMSRFSVDFQLEYLREGSAPATSELELQFARFDDVWVFGHTGQVVDVGTRRSITPVHRGSTKPSLLRTQRLDGVAFSLLTGVPGRRRNYYHFVMETLPEKLAVLHLAVKSFGQLTLLLPESEHPLDTVLVSEARRQFPHLPVRMLPKSEKLRCEAVVVHRVRRSSVFRSPANRQLLSRAVRAMRQSAQVSLKQPVLKTDAATRRLFVSRADAKKRRLLNEEEVFKRVEHFGFENVAPGCLPVADQVSLFSEAQVVVGPHGAGLTNLIFMPEGGAVVENHHSGWVQGAFAWLSHLAGQGYSYVISDSPARDLDYRLLGAQLDAFERKVEAALEEVTAK